MITTKVHIINGKYKFLSDYIAIGLICFFIIIMGFRNKTVGIDTAAYERIYLRVGACSSFIDAIRTATFSGPLYILLCRFIYVVSPNPQFHIFVTSTIVNLGLYVFIKKVSSDKIYSIYLWQVLLFFLFSMNGNRQSMAMIFALNGFLFWIERERRKKIFAIILFVLAVGVHPSVLIMFFVPFGFLITKKISNKRMLFLASCITGILFNLFIYAGANIIIKIVPDYAKYISGKGSSSLLINSGGGRSIILYLFLFCLSLLWITGDKSKSDNKIVDYFFPAMVFGIVVGILNSRNTLISRLLMYFLVFYIIFIPALVEKYDGYTKLIIKVGSILTLFIYYYIALVENKNGVIPYFFFWEY